MKDKSRNVSSYSTSHTLETQTSAMVFRPSKTTPYKFEGELIGSLEETHFKY
jgi:hypothetical protein